MKYIESPKVYIPDPDDTSVFLAGGITNCPDWQCDIADLLEGTHLVLLNPRREHFPIGDPQAAPEQIAWEHRYLRKASAVLFWFPHETLCPIVLYELGAWSMTDKPIFVGVHPEYKRRLDVELQTRFVRPKVKVVYSLQDLASQVADTMAQLLGMLRVPDRQLVASIEPQQPRLIGHMSRPTNIRLKPEPYCPDCGGRMYLRKPTYRRRPGPNPEWEPFWGCGNYPNCRGTRGIQHNGLPEGASMWGRGYDR